MLKDLLHSALLTIMAFTVSIMIGVLLRGDISTGEVVYVFAIGTFTICPPYFIYAFLFLSLVRFVKWGLALSLFISSTLVTSSVMGYLLFVQNDRDYKAYLLIFAVLSVFLFVKILRAKPHLDT